MTIDCCCSTSTSTTATNSSNANITTPMVTMNHPPAPPLLFSHYGASGFHSYSRDHRYHRNTSTGSRMSDDNSSLDSCVSNGEVQWEATTTPHPPPPPHQQMYEQQLETNSSQLEYSHDDESSEEDEIANCNRNYSYAHPAPYPDNFVFTNTSHNRRHRRASAKSLLTTPSVTILASSSPEITALCKSTSFPTTTFPQQRRMDNTTSRSRNNASWTTSSASSSPLSPKALPPTTTTPPRVQQMTEIRSSSKPAVNSWTEAWLNTTGSDSSRHPPLRASTGSFLPPATIADKKLPDLDSIAATLCQMSVQQSQQHLPMVVKRQVSATSSTSATTATTAYHLSPPLYQNNRPTLHRRVSNDMLPSLQQIILPTSGTGESPIQLPSTTTTRGQPISDHPNHCCRE